MPCNPMEYRWQNSAVPSRTKPTCSKTRLNAMTPLLAGAFPSFLRRCSDMSWARMFLLLCRDTVPERENRISTRAPKWSSLVSRHGSNLEAIGTSTARQRVEECETWQEEGAMLPNQQLSRESVRAPPNHSPYARVLRLLPSFAI